MPDCLAAAGDALRCGRLWMRECKDHQEHRQQMAGRERPKRRQEGARTFFHYSGRNRERPPHPGTYPVVEAARNDSQPESRDRPVGPASGQADR
jgi:hypothetical protein